MLSCDASPYRLGAALTHIISGKEMSISYASRNLLPAERNYAQLDKEGAAVIFGLRKFHQYVYGQKFIILTDHKPLLGLFKADKAVLTIACEPQTHFKRRPEMRLRFAGYFNNGVITNSKVGSASGSLQP